MLKTNATPESIDVSLVLNAKKDLLSLILVLYTRELDVKAAGFSVVAGEYHEPALEATCELQLVPDPDFV